jgi:hypothetical protein
MKMSQVVTQWKRIVISAICLLLSGCGSLFPDASTSPLTSTSKLTHHGTVASFDCGDKMVSIGSSNYGVADFIDFVGNSRSEQTSSLWIVISDQPETMKNYRAYTELTIYYYIYRIHVFRLGRDLQNPFTEINVKYLASDQIAVPFTLCT